MAHRIAEVSSGDGVIIRFERNNSNLYLRYDIDQIAELDLHNPNVIHHEIIEDGPQKFYMDIDNVQCDPIHLISRILDHIRCWFYNVYGVEIKENDVIITENIYPDSMSFHLIIDNYALTCAYEAKQFYKKVSSLMSDDVLSTIDVLYKPNQSFRIEGSSKRGKMVYNTRSYNLAPSTYKVSDARGFDHKSSLVGYVKHCVHLPEAFPKEEEHETEYPIDYTDAIGYLYWCFELHDMDLEAFSIQDMGQGIRLTRVRPSFCAMCEREHESDNAKFIVTDDCISYRCWRNRFAYSISHLRKPKINSENASNVFRAKSARSAF